MTELAEREVASWPTGEPVALHPRLQQLTLEIILRAVFGLEEGPTLDRLRDLLTEVLSFTESPLSVLPPLQRAAALDPDAAAVPGRAAARDRRAHLRAHRRAPRRDGADGDGSTRDDVLAMLLAARHEDGSPMSEQELRDELMTALVAGHETTASQLAWALERLAREPAVPRAPHRRARRGRRRRVPSATITEILRLRPVLPNAEPRLTKREVEIGGLPLPAGRGAAGQRVPGPPRSRHLPRAVRVPARAVPRGRRPGPTPGSRSAAAGGAAWAPASPCRR